MPGPVNLNQLIYQSPKVEKIHQVDHEHPDQMQRQAMAEEMLKTRERSETIQNMDQTHETKIRKRDKKEREESESRKKKRARNPESSAEEEEDPQGGGIVDLVV